ncbi:MAG TPA: hypothetical protein VL068_12005 [Microthrixaceae bacterium]|nr:hypothetical protein [Microthrixaceae bacterium]
MDLISATLGTLPAMISLLAHQGGWDEMLMVAVPVAVFAVLLYFANNRASKLGEGSAGKDGTSLDGTGPDGTRNESAVERTRKPINPRRGPI